MALISPRLPGLQELVAVRKGNRDNFTPVTGNVKRNREKESVYLQNGSCNLKGGP
jgi:hypothetical protein